MKKRNIIIIFVVILFIGTIFARFTGLVSTSINTCSDTDSGKNYDLKGTVKGTYYFLIKEEYQETDYCKDENTLIEYYCVNEDMHSYKEKEEFFCELGCEQGKCLESSLKELPTPPDDDYLTIPIKEKEVTGLIQRIREWLGL